MKRFLLAVLLACSLLPRFAYPQEAPLNIVFIPKSSDLAFWKFMRQGSERAVKEAGNINFTWRGPAYDDDTDSQIRIVTAYTRPDVDAIIIVPTDRERLLPPIRKAAALGIKIILVDSGMDGNVHRQFIATDNVSGGKLAARRLAEVLEDKGNVLILRTVEGSASTDERADGFIAYIKANAPKIHIVADEYGGGSKGKAQSTAMRLLKEHQNLSAIFAVNEASTDGMLLALQTSGIAGKIPLMGFDTNETLLEGLRKKEICGLVVQDPRRMGYLGVKAAIEAIKQHPVKEKVLFTDARLVTPDNLNTPDIHALLFP